MFNNFSPEILTVYEVMWKNIVESHRPQITNMAHVFSCRRNKATKKHSECVVLIAIPRQQ